MKLRRSIRNTLIVTVVASTLDVIYCWIYPSSIIGIGTTKTRNPHRNAIITSSNAKQFIISIDGTNRCLKSTNILSVHVQKQQRELSKNNKDDANNKKTKKPAFAQAVHAQRIKESNDIKMSQQKQRKNDKIPSVSIVESQDVNSDVLAVRKTNTLKKQYNSDSFLGSLHTRRVTTAGRIGTKRYIDPCKVYIGNLPFTCTSDELQHWVCNVVGLPSPTILNRCKIIYDWKTSRSKGYGFVVMTEPIYATVLIDKCDTNATLGSMENRRLSVSQGRSKDMEQQLYIEEQQWKVRQLKKRTLEEAVIESGLMEAVQDVVQMTADEIRMLKRLDPDLAEGVQIMDEEESSTSKVNDIPPPDIRQLNQQLSENVTNVDDRLSTKVDDDDDDDISVDDYDDDDDDDDEDVYDWEEVDNTEIYDDSDEGTDGMWYGEDAVVVEFRDDDEETAATILNRAQRRNVTASQKHKKKLPNKGFG